MAPPNDLVVVQRAFPHRAILWPTLRIPEQSNGESFCDPPIVLMQRQVDVYQSVGYRELVPKRRGITATVNNPLIPRQDFLMDRQILLIRDLAVFSFFWSVSPFSKLDY